MHAESRAHPRALLSVEAGGVVFTTIHRFFPEEKGDRHPTLSERRNVVGIAGAAHRSQYDFIDGFARHMHDALPHASFIGLTGTPIELADALETNDSAVRVPGDETLRGVARELVETVRNNVTIDRTLRENVREQLRVLVKRVLRRHGYPRDKEERATQTVLEQAALLSAEWVGA